MELVRNLTRVCIGDAFGSLEAEAYRWSKYEDEQKAEYAEKKVSAVREKVKAEAIAERYEIEQEESSLVLSM